MIAQQKQIPRQNKTIQDAKKFYFKTHIQIFHQLLTLSGLTLKLGYLFQYLIFNDPFEHVMLNDLDIVYSRLKRESYVWFGQLMPRGTGLPSLTKKIETINNLDKLRNQLGSEVTLYIFYYTESYNQSQLPISVTLQQYTQQKTNIKLFPIKNDSQIRIRIKEIQINRKIFTLPNFSELSSNTKDKINQQRYNLYWMLAGQNFREARKDFFAYLRFYLKHEGLSVNAIESEVKQYEKLSENIFRNSEKQIKIYTNDKNFHRILNNSLRSFMDTLDFSYIRFPFLSLFLTIVELFVKQKDQLFRKNGFICYRGSSLSEQQQKQLKISQGKYIQMNGFLSASMLQSVALGFGKDLITILVPPFKQSRNFFHSFARIEEHSQYQYQKQILFNPLNVFKIQQVSTDGQCKRVLLKYINVDEIVHNPDKRQGQVEKNLVENYRYQKQMLILNRNFPWYSDEQKNMRLVDQFIINNKKRAIEMYFIISKIQQNNLDLYRMLSYLLFCFQTIVKFITSKNAIIYIFLVNIGQANLKLDQYYYAKFIFKLAYEKYSLFDQRQFRNSHAVILFLYYETETYEVYAEFRNVVLGHVRNMHESNTVGYEWVKFIQNFQDIRELRDFHNYYTKNFSRPELFLKFLVFYQTEEYLLQIQSKVQQNKPLNQHQKSTLQILKQLLNFYNDLHTQQQHFRNSLYHTCLYLASPDQNIKSIHEHMTTWQQQNIQNNSIWRFHYYQLRLHLSTLRYMVKLRFKLNRNHYNLVALMPKHLLLVSKVLLTKFRSNFYLHFVFIMVLMDYCWCKNQRKFTQIGIQLLKIAKQIKKKLKKVLNLDIYYLRKMQEKLQKQYNQIK